MAAPSFTLDLDIDRKSGAVVARVLGETRVVNESSYPAPDASFSQENFLLWVTDVFREVLFNEDFENAVVDYRTGSPEIHAKYAEAMDRFAYLVGHTQDLIKKHKPRFGAIDTFNGRLFYNVDDFTLFHELFQSIDSLAPGNNHYLNALSGWDKAARSWSGKSDSLNLDQLLEHLLRHKIRTLYSVNMHYLFQIMEKESFFVLPFFKALGLHWIIIDYDLYEGKNGLLLNQRNTFTTPSFTRFSLWPHLFAEIDRKHGNSRVFYFVPSKECVRDVQIRPIGKNPEAIILSHARIQNVLAQLPRILSFLENTDPRQPYLDMQILYYALTHLIFSDEKTHEVTRIARFSDLTSVYFDTFSFLKYEIVQSLLEHGMRTKIYGDDAWEALFPTAYQKAYLDEAEIRELFHSDKNRFYVLMNQNYSYFENNLAVSRALQQNVPYLCFPAVAVTDDLKGMRLLEYESSDSLIEKIPRFNLLSQDVSYRKSLESLTEKNAACRGDFLNAIARATNPPDARGVFDSIYRAHASILMKELKSYFELNHERIFGVYDRFLSGSDRSFPILKSRYATLGFFDRLLNPHSNQGPRS